MIRAGVFLKAAERLSDPSNFLRLSCLNIAKAAGRNPRFYETEPHVLKFQELFQPEIADKDDSWYGPCTPENQLARQLGLLLCAEVLKDEAKASRHSQRSQKRKSK